MPKADNRGAPIRPWTTAPTPPGTGVRSGMTPEIVGHRGARGLFPENTLEGFRQCLAMGLRTFELDVGMTADGVVVVAHDTALNPAITRDASGEWLSGGEKLIHEMTFAALGGYDVGRIRPASAYRLAHRAQKAAEGARIPTLDAVLGLAADSRFIIEMKTDPRHPEWTAKPAVLADAVLAVVDAAGAADRVILESFDWRGPRYIRRIRPELRTAWLTREETVRDAALWWDGLAPADFGHSVPAAVAAQGDAAQGDAAQGDAAQVDAAQGDAAQGDAAQGALAERVGRKTSVIWAPAFETLTRAAVAEAHALGLRVIPWTINRRSMLRRAFAWCVDGVITDRPDVALAVRSDSAETANGQPRRRARVRS